MFEVIHIVTVTNNAYAEPLAVMLNSLLENKVSKNPIEIYVIASELSRRNKNLLAKTVGKFNIRLNFISIDPTIYKSFKMFYYLTQETYYRLSIPDLLNEKIQKVIYLDCDLIIKTDITELWNFNIDNYLLGAVEDFGIRNKRNKRLFIPKEAKYFNAGVLLINLKKWREERVKDETIDFIKNHASRIKYCDQDALNAILHGKWLPLDREWNFMPHLTYPELKKKKPAIIHFAGPQKPWNANCRLKKEYYRYWENVFI